LAVLKKLSTCSGKILLPVDLKCQSRTLSKIKLRVAFLSRRKGSRICLVVIESLERDLLDLEVVRMRHNQARRSSRLLQSCLQMH
jgi:hypothetical protein